MALSSGKDFNEGQMYQSTWRRTMLILKGCPHSKSGLKQQ